MALKKKLLLLCLGILATNNVSAMMYALENLSNNASSDNNNFYANYVKSNDKSVDNVYNANNNVLEANYYSDNKYQYAQQKDWANLNPNNSGYDTDYKSNDINFSMYNNGGVIGNAQIQLPSLEDLKSNNLIQLLNFAGLVEYSSNDSQYVNSLKNGFIKPYIDSIVETNLSQFLIKIFGPYLFRWNVIDLALDALQKLEISLSEYSVQQYYSQIQAYEDSLTKNNLSTSKFSKNEMSTIYQLLKSINTGDTQKLQDVFLPQLAQMIMQNQDSTEMMLFVHCFMNSSSLEARNKLIEILNKKVEDAAEESEEVESNIYCLINSLLLKNLFAVNYNTNANLNTTSQFLKDFILLRNNYKELSDRGNFADNVKNYVASSISNQVCSILDSLNSANPTNDSMKNFYSPEPSIINAMWCYCQHIDNLRSVNRYKKLLETGDNDVFKQLVSNTIGNWQFEKDKARSNARKQVPMQSQQHYWPEYIKTLLGSDQITCDNISGLLSLMNKVSNALSMNENSNSNDLDKIDYFKHQVKTFGDSTCSDTIQMISYFSDTDNLESVNDFKTFMGKYGYGKKLMRVVNTSSQNKYTIQHFITNNNFDVRSVLQILNDGNKPDEESTIAQSEWLSWIDKIKKNYNNMYDENKNLFQERYQILMALHDALTQSVSRHVNNVHINVTNLQAALINILKLVQQSNVDDNHELDWMLTTFLPDCIKSLNLSQLKKLLANFLNHQGNNILSSQIDFMDFIIPKLQEMLCHQQDDARYNIDKVRTNLIHSSRQFILEPTQLQLSVPGAQDLLNSQILTAEDMDRILPTRLELQSYITTNFPGVNLLYDSGRNSFQKLIMNTIGSTALIVEIYKATMYNNIVQKGLVGINPNDVTQNDRDTAESIVNILSSAVIQKYFNQVNLCEAVNYKLAGLVDSSFNNYSFDRNTCRIVLPKDIRTIARRRFNSIFYLYENPLLSGIVNGLQLLNYSLDCKTTYQTQITQCEDSYRNQVANVLESGHKRQIISGLYDSMVYCISSLNDALFSRATVNMLSQINDFKAYKKQVLSILHNTVVQHQKQLPNMNDQQTFVYDKMQASPFYMYFLVSQIIDRVKKNGNQQLKYTTLTEREIHNTNIYCQILEQLKNLTNNINNDNALHTSIVKMLMLNINTINSNLDFNNLTDQSVQVNLSQY